MEPDGCAWATTTGSPDPAARPQDGSEVQREVQRVEGVKPDGAIAWNPVG